MYNWKFYWTINSKKKIIGQQNDINTCELLKNTHLKFGKGYTLFCSCTPFIFDYMQNKRHTHIFENMLHILLRKWIETNKSGTVDRIQLKKKVLWIEKPWRESKLYDDTYGWFCFLKFAFHWPFRSNPSTFSLTRTIPLTTSLFL